MFVCHQYNTMADQLLPDLLFSLAQKSALPMFQSLKYESEETGKNFSPLQWKYLDNDIHKKFRGGCTQREIEIRE